MCKGESVQLGVVGVMAKPCPALCIKTLKPARHGGHCFISIRIMISREIVNEMK